MEHQFDEARQTFIQESRDLLRAMETELLRAEAGESDAESINSLFRSAHTIKGSAGLFGLEPIVAFTHVVESVLDQVRDGDTALDGDLVNLLIECGDHIGALVTAVAEQGTQEDDRLAAVGERLLAGLSGYLQLTAAADAVKAAAPTQQASTSASAGDAGEAGSRGSSACWHISLRFGADIFRHGMDPLSFVAHLASLGEVRHLTTMLDGIPPRADFDPESCYLGFEIELASASSKAELEAVFDFAQDACTVRIVPPGSQLVEYARLIAALPEDDLRLGEILVRSGALTQVELESALRTQNALTDPKPRLGEVIVEQALVDQSLVNVAVDRQQRGLDKRTSETKYLKVAADRLDELINLVGELVIAGATAASIAVRDRNTAMIEAAANVSGLVENIRDSALRMRMVPIGETFSRFNRVVRDVSRELGKDIELRISGADAELDKTMVERIADPLMHMVRNAIDHGIESPERRAAQGKPARGVLQLNAYHDSGNIVIEVGDDGAGLNREKILAKAVERGIVEAGRSLTESETYALIFEPGFSTADQVTNLSGRGVGMDVVRRSIMALRGSIDIRSEAGAGTTVIVRLPLTLAIIDGFLVGLGKSVFVIPLDLIEECVESFAEAGRDYTNLRGQVLPLIRLHDLLGVAATSARRQSVVVVKYAGQKVGLIVDTLLGEFQTVIKPLSKMFQQVKCISGSTILGSGEVALILDVAAIVQHVVHRESRGVAHTSHKALPPADSTTVPATRTTYAMEAGERS